MKNANSKEQFIHCMPDVILNYEYNKSIKINSRIKVVSLIIECILVTLSCCFINNKKIYFCAMTGYLICEIIYIILCIKNIRYTSAIEKEEQRRKKKNGIC